MLAPQRLTAWGCPGLAGLHLGSSMALLTFQTRKSRGSLGQGLVGGPLAFAHLTPQRQAGECLLGIMGEGALSLTPRDL